MHHTLIAISLFAINLFVIDQPHIAMYWQSIVFLPLLHLDLFNRLGGKHSGRYWQQEVEEDESCIQDESNHASERHQEGFMSKDMCQRAATMHQIKVEGNAF